MAEYEITGTRNGNEFVFTDEAEGTFDARKQFLIDVGVIDARELRKIAEEEDYDVNEFVEKQESQNEEWDIENVRGIGKAS